MKHRCLSLLFALLAVCVLLGGCREVPEPQQTQAPTTAADTPTQTTPPPVETQPPAAEPEDLLTQWGQGQLPGPSAMPAYASQTDIPYLYACDLPLPDEFADSTLVHGEVLHIYYWQTGSFCDLYDLADGTFIRRVDLAPCNNWGELEDGGLWTLKYDTMEVTLYDRRGGETQYRASAQGLAGALFLNYAQVSRDGRYLLATYDTGDILEVYDLPAGTVTQVDVPLALNAWSMDAYRDGFLVGDYDSVFYFLDLQTLELEFWGEAQYKGTHYHGLFHYYHENALILGTGMAGQQRFYLEHTEEENLDEVNFGHAVTQIYGEKPRLRFYDLRRECLLGELTLEDPGYSICTDILPNGTVLISNQAEQLRIFLYDLPSLAQQAEGTPVPVMCATEQDIVDATDALAQEILDATGVELMYGSAGNDFNIYGYVANAQLEPYSVYTGVRQAGQILTRYPEGMLRQTYEKTHKGLRVYLCGDIHGVDSTSVSSAGGVTSESDGYIVIAVEARGNLAYDLPHELSHAFDRRIEYTDSTQGTDWMGIWNSATDLRDGYLYSYENYGGYTDYTAYGWDTQVWFVDSYARTFPTEDRARIMEHLANTQEPASAQLFQHPHLLEKAQLYAYILRRCFPACDTGQVHFWEQLLGPIDASVLP